MLTRAFMLAAQRDGKALLSLYGNDKKGFDVELWGVVYKREEKRFGYGPFETLSLKRRQVEKNRAYQDFKNAMAAQGVDVDIAKIVPGVSKRPTKIKLRLSALDR